MAAAVGSKAAVQVTGSAAAEESPRAGRLANLLCGAAVAGIGVAALWAAMELGLGSLTQPRAGTWPGIVSALLILVGVLIMTRAATYDDAERITSRAVGVLIGVASLVAMGQLIPLIGFEVPSFLLLVFWMSVLGKERLRLSVPLSAITVLAFYLIFITGLSVPLPRLF
ncbi:tripartite tricarboxylate transporter TctB family protein [Nesterenkonia sp. HG001]|uniref:tripartite tricarboxylate transporter TctB family protein n=1 Tax=Nesterenkonia sp. HG001 TaxID=2983207 RepID=UPI002AC5FA37|nr:tripartite tricarboxylate transporter TctB family protein [Nesterenkonia sp. HG001]MDZ5077178.1 tripartite tricarboxylate transporter TctB family protein [Nesterenkonia sp. HG001]